jgi:hypothetical protein
MCSRLETQIGDKQRLKKEAACCIGASDYETNGLVIMRCEKLPAKASEQHAWGRIKGAPVGLAAAVGAGVFTGGNTSGSMEIGPNAPAGAVAALNSCYMRATSEEPDIKQE